MDLDAEIAWDYVRGKSHVEMAERLGVSRYLVSRRISAMLRKKEIVRRPFAISRQRGRKDDGPCQGRQQTGEEDKAAAGEGRLSG